jgi:hypothetical protein
VYEWFIHLGTHRNIITDGSTGGHRSDEAWEVLAVHSLTSKDNFRKFVTDPHSINPASQMPPHPTFDDDTFNALEAYFKAMMLIE